MATIHNFYPQYSQDTQQETKLGSALLTYLTVLSCWFLFGFLCWQHCWLFVHHFFFWILFRLKIFKSKTMIINSKLMNKSINLYHKVIYTMNCTCKSVGLTCYLLLRLISTEVTLMMPWLLFSVRKEIILLFM